MIKKYYDKNNNLINIGDEVRYDGQRCFVFFDINYENELCIKLYDKDACEVYNIDDVKACELEKLEDKYIILKYINDINNIKDDYTKKINEIKTEYIKEIKKIKEHTNAKYNELHINKYYKDMAYMYELAVILSDMTLANIKNESLNNYYNKMIEKTEELVDAINAHNRDIIEYNLEIKKMYNELLINIKHNKKIYNHTIFINKNDKELIIKRQRTHYSKSYFYDKNGQINNYTNEKLEDHILKGQLYEAYYNNDDLNEYLKKYINYRSKENTAIISRIKRKIKDEIIPLNEIIKELKQMKL